ncbi:glycosyltransferase family 2 protein [Bacillus mycoides]|uniref:glycosyltransferase n=1 Tax=Bacillus mycoides TaxID=1405 RepID=UPI0010C5A440|nr:glycosyltransferase family 2 protein [Bacillus mycoides]QBP93527.1 glycosyltransferase family 2 protein [Bacillus mycoides]WOA63404.1 glycosyltransferase family 2 protein [Bacillus mycoides]
MNNKISLILPTLGEREEEFKRLIVSLNKQIYKEFEVVFVTQGNHDELEKILTLSNFKYKQIKLNRKGLSFARNEGIKHITGGIVTFSDDDCWYPENALELVVKEFENRDVEALSFQIFDPESEQYYKAYRQNSVDVLDFRGVLKISSIEFFINLNKVKKEDLNFDERFGLGAQYPSGEENILLADLLQKKYKVSYINQIIVFHKKKTSETKLISSRTFIGKGPLFKRMRGTIPAICMLTVFLLRKFSITEKPISSFRKSLKELLDFKQ